MGIGRDEMGSEKGEEKRVKCVNTSSSVNRVNLDNIEEWLLVEVLIRLPVKFIFRFKLVCKQWLSIISDPSFMLMYVSRASIFPQSQAWTFVSHIMYDNGSRGWDFTKDQLLGDIYSRDIKPPSVHMVRCPSAQHQDTGKYTIAGMSNGLVLYGLRVDRGRHHFSRIANYTICNPITGQRTRLPPHNRSFEHVCSSFVAHVENNILKSYRVVRLNTHIKSSNKIAFEVFSSETGKWKDVDVTIDIEIQILLQWNPTSVNGILHWITHRHGLIAYDPYHKPDRVRIIALPDDSHRCSRIFYAHQGILRYFKMACSIMRQPESLTFSAWVLNDYSTGDWSLQHRITTSDIIHDGVFPSQNLSPLQPVSFHPFDSDIVYLLYKRIFVSYNIKTRKLETHGDPVGVEGYCNKMPYWRSPFIIPPWPICIPSSPFGVKED